MRRLFIILLLFVVPFQGAWAGAARYCVDGDDAGRTHFGHHIHIDVGDEERTPSKKVVHGDCLACHLVSMHAVFLDVAMPTTEASVKVVAFLPIRDDFESCPASTPERPNWACLA